MIQRIQSLFLVVAATALALLFKYPLAKSDVATAQLFSDRQFNIQDHPVMLILSGAGMLLAIVTIFLFKNRTLQIKLSNLVVVLSILLVIVAAALFLNDTKNMGTVSIEDALGAYLPLVAIVFGILAGRFIKKDERLVRSADRLR